jgi:hypothetical protein
MLGHTVPEVKRVEIDPAAIATFSRESEFTALAVDLMVETASYCCIAAGTLGARTSWDRDTAAVAGNMVRQYKLLDAFLDQVCKHRDETGMILARLVFETTVNIRFLIRNFTPSLIDSYIRHSLRHERRLRDRIRKAIDERGGVTLHIEDRMLRSIERAARAAFINLDEIDLKDKQPWGGKNIFEKARGVGLEKFYSAAFGGGSHSIHGNWQELYANHLEWEDGSNEFTPKLTWKMPRPQLVTSFAILINDTIKIFFQFIAGDEASNYFDPLLDDLHHRVLDLVDAHEKYLSKKTWPKI